MTEENRPVSLEAQVSAVVAKVDMLVGEMRERDNQRQAEMRDRDNQRQAEIAEIREDIKEIYRTTDAKIDSINKSISSMYNQNIVVIIGVIAIAVAVFLK